MYVRVYKVYTVYKCMFEVTKLTLEGTKYTLEVTTAELGSRCIT